MISPTQVVQKVSLRRLRYHSSTCSAAQPGTTLNLRCAALASLRSRDLSFSIAVSLAALLDSKSAALSPQRSAFSTLLVLVIAGSSST